jgi:hypothetical protein
VAKDGGTPVTLASSIVGHGIAVDATSVYVAAVPDILKIPLDGGAPTTLAMGSDASVPNYVAVDADHLYWTDFWESSVKRVPVAGGLVTAVISGEAAPAGIALDATNVYWARAGSYNRAEGAIRKLPK